MSHRIAILAAFAVGAVFLAAQAGNAEAGRRLHLNLYPPFVHYDENRYYPEPPPPDYYDYGEPIPYDQAYGYEEDYYYGNYGAAPPGYQKPLVKRKYLPRSAYQEPNAYQPAPKPKVTKKPVTQAYAAPTIKPNTASSSKKMSCEKAKTIIGGYGFNNVRSQTCDGSVYNFLAQRDGKNFAIKVSSMSGELTEVKRQ